MACKNTKMMTETRDIWIQTGYKIFAFSGPEALKIEPLAKKVGISKSSFYHHFADLELFIEDLLKHHLQQSYVIADKENNCKNIDPELIQVLVDHKTDLLFNRQLRVLRAEKVFKEVLHKSDAIIGNSFLPVWIKELNLNLNPNQQKAIYELALENFFLQITPENLTQAWLGSYFANLKRIAQQF
jgi:AcrR family transcriptional regulator